MKRARKSPATLRAEAIAEERASALYSALRVLRVVDPAALYDACDHFTETEDVDDGIRLAVYGFNARHNMDVVVLQIGIGAGESVLDVDTDTAAVLTQRWAQYPVWSPYRIVRERVAAWMLQPEVSHKV